MSPNQYLGTFPRSLDPKARLLVPAKLRKVLDEEQTAVADGQPAAPQNAEPGECATKVFLTFFKEDNCLFMYSPQGWHEASKGFSRDPFKSREERERARQFFGVAEDVDLDGTGRCLIPKELKEKAKIDREVVIVGVGSGIEIWSPERWARRNDGPEKDAPEGQSTDVPAQDG